MPTFAEIPLNTLTDTMYRPGTTPVSAEYAEYIRRLTPGNAGILDVAPQENIGVVRARVSAAARQLKMPLKIRREDHRIFFWVDGGTS